MVAVKTVYLIEVATVQLAQSVDLFLNVCAYERSLATRTVRAYRSDLLDFVQHGAKSLSIDDCSSEVISDYLQSMLTKRQLAKSTVKRRFVALSQFFDWICSQEQRGDNPLAKLDIRIRIPDNLPRFLTRGEVAQILASPLCSVDVGSIWTSCHADLKIARSTFNHLTTRVAIELLLTTGMRVGELVAVRCSDVCCEQRVVRLNGKGSRERNVFVTDNGVADLISLYLKVRQIQFPDCESDMFLLNGRGRPASDQCIRTRVRTIAKNAGLSKRVTPHMFRHTAATLLLESSVDIRFVQRLLGHRSISTTQIYSHVTDTSLRAVLTEANIRQVIHQSVL